MSSRGARCLGRERIHHLDATAACSCLRPLRRSDLTGRHRRGRWVPTLSLSRASGLSDLRLIVPGASILSSSPSTRNQMRESVKTRTTTSTSACYTPRGRSLPRETVLACRRDYTMPEAFSGVEFVSAGVDVGAVIARTDLLLVPQRARGAALHRGDRGFDELALLWERYGVSSVWWMSVPVNVVPGRSCG